MALLKVFNPHELSADIVVAVATGREQELEQILSVVRDNLSAPIKQHIIVSAPRGYGKSFFLRYIEVRIAEIAIAEGLPIVMALLPEELPHVKEADTLIAEIKRTFLRQPAESVEVRWTEDAGGAWEDAIVELDRAVEERFIGGRGLLVAGVENFDLLVKKAFAKPAPSGRLREFLTRPGSRVMLLAASARGAFDRDYDRPLFKVFEEVALQPWTIEQTVEFLVAQRKAAGKLPLTDTQLAKAKAVAIFISGTPRLATLIGEALLEDDPLGAADVLEKLVDELTPYYKERIEILPTRSQILLDALLRGGERCSATELAKRVGAASQSAIAAPLEDLKKDLVVVGEKAPDSAEVLLRVADRVFAHYYRKRILNHGQETCPLEALVEILALIYSPEEKRHEAEKFAARGLAREAALMKRLWEADRESAALSQRLALNSEFDRFLEEWDTLASKLEFEKSLPLVERALLAARSDSNIENESRALRQMAWTLGELGRHDEAIAAAREAVMKSTEFGAQAAGLRHIAWNLGQLGRHEEALSTARQALARATEVRDPEEQTIALLHISWCLGELGQHEEALAMAQEALSKASEAELISEQSTALRLVARSFGDLGRHEEALASARKAFEKTKQSDDVREYVRAACMLLFQRPADADLALEAYARLLREDVSITRGDPKLFFEAVANVASSKKAWPALIDLLGGFPEQVVQIVGNDDLGAPGRVVSRLSTSGRSDEALVLARHFVAALSQATNNQSNAPLARFGAAVLDASTRAIALEVDNARVLHEFARILAAHPAVPASALALSHAAASYHATDRDPQTLVRLDPDLATMLTTVFPPEKVVRKPKLKSRKKTRR